MPVFERISASFLVYPHLRQFSFPALRTAALATIIAGASLYRLRPSFIRSANAVFASVVLSEALSFATGFTAFARNSTCLQKASNLYSAVVSVIFAVFLVFFCEAVVSSAEISFDANSASRV